MLEKLFILLRFLFCLLGAAGLLYAFSYPDALVPPDPWADEEGGITLHKIKPVIWVLPVLFMELVSIAGPRRNLVWFAALFTVLGAALLAYPLLDAWYPEYVKPTFEYQGSMLSGGLVSYAVFIAISYLFRKVLLAYTFPSEELQDQIEAGYVSASVLDPSRARTVKEIAADPKADAPRFHFHEGDKRLALRFKLIMRRMLLRSRLANASLAGGVLLLALWITFFPRPTVEEMLQRDKQTMLEYRLTANGYPLATSAAMHAAARVMKYISDHESHAGMQAAEAERWLGVDKLPDSVRAHMRDARPIKLASVNSMHENRTRFLTITDGKRYCVLYIRPNVADGSIVVSEMVDSGWDAVADRNRRRIVTDWGAYFN